MLIYLKKWRREKEKLVIYSHSKDKLNESANEFNILWTINLVEESNAPSIMHYTLVEGAHNAAISHSPNVWAHVTKISD